MSTVVIQLAHDLGHRARLQECLEHKSKPLLDRDIGILDDHTARIAREANRQSERELAALGLGEKTGRQTAPDGMQFQFRYRAFQPKKQAAVGAARIIDAVPIRDEATAQPTNIQQRIPVRTIARQAGYVDRQDHAHRAEPDATNKFLERLTLRIAGLERARFGRRSEQLSEDALQRESDDLEQSLAEQSDKLNEAAAALEKQSPDAPAPTQPPKRDRGALPAHLPRVEIVVDVGDKTGPCRGKPLHVIGEDRAEMLDYVPARLSVRVIRRPRYGCRGCEEAVVQTPTP